MSKSIAKKVEAFEAAVRDHAWRGTYSEDPDHVADIDREYVLRKSALMKAIRSMMTHNPRRADNGNT